VLERGTFWYCCSQQVPGSSENLYKSWLFSSVISSSSVLALLHKYRSTPQVTSFQVNCVGWGSVCSEKHFFHQELPMVFKRSCNSVASYCLCVVFQLCTMPAPLLKSLAEVQQMNICDNILVSWVGYYLQKYFFGYFFLTSRFTFEKSYFPL